MRHFCRASITQAKMAIVFMAILFVGTACFVNADPPTAGRTLLVAGDAPRASLNVVPLSSQDPRQVAARVDQIIASELTQTKTPIAPRCNDEDFLRRVSFDIAGISPSAQDVTLFGLDPDPNKRSRLIDRLLDSEDYATNWTRYWRDVIYMRATEMRARSAQSVFEAWMTEQFKLNRTWDQIATAMITATGDVQEKGETALIFAQDGDANELAAETSRIFMGIQLQCANCHDHPTDSWKRQQFHELAAFFPRIRMARQPNNPLGFEVTSFNPPPGMGGRPGMGGPADLLRNPEQLLRMLDRDGDGAISRSEGDRGPGGQLFTRLLDNADANKDGKVTVEEMKKAPPPPMMGRRPTPEHLMPDLQNPSSEGIKVDPVFFVHGEKPGSGLSDLERRQSLSRYLTSVNNPWFAKAFINRIWAELLGEGFYMPIDDMGPERTPVYPAALDTLAAGFIANNYDIKWVFRVIANSEAYQREIRPRSASQPSQQFASAMPVRLRSDHLYTALERVLGIPPNLNPSRMGPPGAGVRGGDRSPRGQFNAVFGVDPSTPPDEVSGTIPQALAFMNGPEINRLIRAEGRTRLGIILQKFPQDKDAIIELYILVHAREPSANELQVCQTYLKEAPTRMEAFEDILWTLLNSTEFQTKR